MVNAWKGKFCLLVAFATLVAACSSDKDSAREDVAVNPPEDVIVEDPLDFGVPVLPYVGGPILFTEVDPINTDYEDHEGGDAGWVELFNSSLEPVSLKGISLTNSQAEPEKWTFGDVVIEPQSFMQVYLSGKNLPNYVAPHDSFDLIGPGCWTWTDAQSDDVPGESYSEPLEGKSKLCFLEQGKRMFGSRMRLGKNEELGWSSISAFVGTGSSDPEDVLDISTTNEILMRAFITKDRKVSFRLAQTGVDDWKGYETVLTGTGDSSTVYRYTLPTGKKLPDLKIIYGTRMSPEEQEKEEVTVKVFSYVARNRGNEPHASFKIKNEGGSLYLVNANHEILDSVAYPKVPVGKTWSLGNNAGVPVWGFANPSLNAIQESVVAERSPSVDSLNELPPSGFYQIPFAVSFDESAFVHCEFGGKEPSESGAIVTSILVDTTKVIRCASFVPGKMPGEVFNRTYVFENAPKVPAVFVTTDPESLFDPDSGIYMEGNNASSSVPHYGANYWLDKEIPVFVELHEVGMGRPAFAENAGLKIFGNYSRANAKKSVVVTFREKYGKKRLKYPLFPDFPGLTEFKTFILRNNGSNFGNDYIRDRLASSISEGLGVDYQRGRGVIVYYNGEYYGIHNIRERSTEYYFETHYGYDPDEIDLLKADNSASAGSSVDYAELMDWIETHDMSKDENLSYVAERIDIDNFMNYMQTVMFANNRDWPANNLKKWRCENPSTKWKWFMYDTDFGFGNGYSEYTNNIFDFATTEDGESWPNGPESTFLLRSLLKNMGFRTSFVNRMTALLSMNFESSRILSRVDELMQEIESEIARDQKRWRLSVSKMSGNLSNIKKFASTRQSVILSELQEFFGLGDATPVTLSVQGNGSILIHNLPLDRSPIEIDFFEGTPLVVTAVPGSGSVWMGWNDGSVEATRIIMPEDYPNLIANFK